MTEQRTDSKWYEGLAPQQFPLSIQEAGRVEGVRIVPHTGVSVDRVQVGYNDRSFGNGEAPERWETDKTHQKTLSIADNPLVAPGYPWLPPVTCGL